MKRIDLPRTVVTRILQQIQRNVATARQGQFKADNIAAGIWHVHEQQDQIPDAVAVANAGDLYLGIYLGTQGVLQMHGWQLENNAVTAVEIGITDGNN